MTNFQKNFASRLRELRTAKGLSQEQLAEAVGVSPKTTSYWENGHNAVTFNKIPLIAKALEVPVYQLFVFEDIKTGDTKAIENLLKSMPKNKLDCIAAIIKSLDILDGGKG